MTQEQQTFVNN